MKEKVLLIATKETDNAAPPGKKVQFRVSRSFDLSNSLVEDEDRAPTETLGLVEESTRLSAASSPAPREKVPKKKKKKGLFGFGVKKHMGIEKQKSRARNGHKKHEEQKKVKVQKNGKGPKDASPKNSVNASPHHPEDLSIELVSQPQLNKDHAEHSKKKNIFTEMCFFPLSFIDAIYEETESSPNGSGFFSPCLAFPKFVARCVHQDFAQVQSVSKDMRAEFDHRDELTKQVIMCTEAGQCCESKEELDWDETIYTAEDTLSYETELTAADELKQELEQDDEKTHDTRDAASLEVDQEKREAVDQGGAMKPKVEEQLVQDAIPAMDAPSYNGDEAQAKEMSDVEPEVEEKLVQDAIPAMDPPSYNGDEAQAKEMSDVEPEAEDELVQDTIPALDAPSYEAQTEELHQKTSSIEVQEQSVQELHQKTSSIEVQEQSVQEIESIQPDESVQESSREDKYAIEEDMSIYNQGIEDKKTIQGDDALVEEQVATQEQESQPRASEQTEDTQNKMADETKNSCCSCCW
jgi:hypothetical protein